jgi:TonB-linked SusC/RagA family outer membrane protein
MLTKRATDRVGLAICVLMLLFSSLTPALAQPAKAKGRDITGTVVDVDTTPVANATVAVTGGGPSAVTAADGSFTLAGVATTNVTIDVTADGFTSKQIPVLGAAAALQLQIVVVKPAAPIAAATRMVGGVVSDASHAPIAGATVRVHGTDLQVLTAADGSFTLPGVAVGEVTIDVEAANQPPVRVTVPADRAALVVTVGPAAPPAPGPATTRTIRGNVIETPSKEPIVAAEVKIAGSQTLVFSDPDGTFVLDGVALGPVQLEITAAGHEVRTIPVAASTNTVSVTLGLVEGEQIIVQGRAPSISKQHIVNGGSVIEGKDLTRVPAATLDDAMTGKLAGANLQSNSGAPGGGAQLRLRGVSTINGQSSPLYVIDGVIISNISTPGGVNAVTGAAGGGNPSTQDNAVNRIADLNPNDIENIEVLKGASAAALYGSKAANGVVIITTKRGRQGENHASVTQRIGFSQVSKHYGDRTWHSIDEVKSQFCGPTDTPAKCDANPYVMAYVAAGGKTYDHEAEITRTPFLTETLANVTGGTENGNYYGSVLISDQPGVVIGTFYKKQSGRVAVGYKFFDRLNLGLTANVIHSLSDRGLSNNDNTGVSPYFVFSVTPNFIDLREKNGIYPANIAVSGNPLQNVALFQNRQEVTRGIIGATASLDAFSTADNEHKIKLLGNFGADTFVQKDNVISPVELTFENDDGLPGTVVDGSTTNLNLNVGTSATWAYTPHSGLLRSGLTAGLTYESVDLHSVYVIARNLTAGQTKTDSATSVRSNENNLRTKELGGYLQEELSMLDDRLSILGGVLAERSSLNGDSNKYFLYPKLGGAYSLLTPNKPAAGALDAFESLRVRAAYGETGNRPNYTNKFTALSAVNNIDGTGTVIFNPNAGSSGLEPERQREIELGVDTATKDQRVVVELTAYQRSISNMLLQRALATTTGFTTQFINGGSMHNRGIEAAVSLKPLPTKLVDWTTRGTLTLNRSKVTELPDGVPAFNIPVGFGAGFGAYRIEVGKSATQIVANDANGKLVSVGDGEPDFRVGWSNVVTAGDFTLSTLLDWQHGSKVINLTTQNYDGNGNAPDQEAAAKRLAAKSFLPYIEDGSFVKVREISVTYNLPKQYVSQLGPLKNLSVTVSGRNLLTFTSYTGLDPEVSNFGSQPIARNIDVTPYPPSRSYWLSVTAGI